MLEEQLSDEGVVQACERLARAERAFRHMKTVGRHLRPFCARSHATTCLLACCPEWHMRRLAPPPYDEENSEREVKGADGASGARRGY